ncbi:MAG: sigma-70 family RNA polymerase sigma factor [Odoribacteraceae bacterium]|jgi:RNA polymerase sigma-70 factor (ECF subfamily)|nr:sigma-70 family RNA polymerase sigma factor [Odoribacteraceae bacterium]
MNVSIQTHKEFKKFFEDFFPAVHAFLLRYTKEKELSRDLAQETFIKIYEKRGEIPDIEHAKAFLYTIARNLYEDHRKRVCVQKKFLSYIEPENAWEDHLFLKEVTRQETLRILYAAINKLPARGQTIILARLQGKSFLEIANEMNVSINTVKSLKKSAITTLRTLLSREHLLLLLILIGD